MFRDRPEPRERHVAVRVRMPARLVDRLNREADAIASPLLPVTRARDSLVADLVERGLQRLPNANATRCKL